MRLDCWDPDPVVRVAAAEAQIRATPPRMYSRWWRDQAACQGTDIGVWFDGQAMGGRGIRPADEDTVIHVCEACPVSLDCLWDTLKAETGDALRPLPAAHRSGIYAGLGPTPRARLGFAVADLLVPQSRPTGKRCPECGAVKPLACFGPHPTSSDGLRARCKACVGERPKAHRDDITVTEKQCRRCGTVKPSSEFYMEKRNKDGLSGQCMDCVRRGRVELAARRALEAGQ